MTTKTDAMIARLDSILEQLEALGITGQSPAVPVTHIDANGNPGLVAPGELIESAWGNAVVPRVVHRFSTFAEMQAWAGASNGAFAITTSNNVVYMRHGTTWRPTTFGAIISFAATGGGAGQVVPRATLTQAVFSFAETDPNTVITGGTFTVPVGWAGRWSFDWRVDFPDASQNGIRLALLSTTGKRWCETNVPAQEGGTLLSGSVSVVLAEGAQAAVVFYHTDALANITCNTKTDSYFQGHYAGPF